MKINGAVLNHRTHIIISGIWFLGLLLGIWISFLSQSTYPNCNSVFLSHQISISGIILSVILPLICIVFGFAFRLKWLIGAVIFIKAFLYGFSFYYLTIAGGPVFRSIQMFSNSLSVLLLLVLGFHFNGATLIKKQLYYIFLFAVIICLLDIFLSFFLIGR